MDPTATYPYVDGANQDAKHPNGDLDRISLVGDLSIGGSFLLRGEPVVWSMNALKALTFNGIIRAAQVWYSGQMFTREYEEPDHDVFNRMILKSDVHDILNGVKTISRSVGTEGSELIVPCGSDYSYVDDAGIRRPSRDFKTADIPSPSLLSVPKISRIRSIVADLESIVNDGWIELRPGTLNPAFRGYSTNLPDSDCDCTVSGDDARDESALFYGKYRSWGYFAEDLYVYSHTLGAKDPGWMHSVYHVQPLAGLRPLIIKSPSADEIVALFEINVWENGRRSAIVWLPIRMTRFLTDSFYVPSEAFRNVDVMILSSAGLEPPQPEGGSSYSMKSTQFICSGIHLLVSLKKDQ